VTRRGRDIKLQSLCPHSTISRPGLLSFSWLYRSEQSLDLRATLLEQGRRDLKPQITQLITLNNSSTRIENSHNILWSPADQLLIEIMPKQLEKTPQRLYRRSVPSPNTARRAVRSAYHRNIPHYNLFPISHVSKDENTKLLSAEKNCAQYVLPFRFLVQETVSTEQSLRCVEAP
jgi:hypothetical protein